LEKRRIDVENGSNKIVLECIIEKKKVSTKWSI